MHDHQEYVLRHYLSTVCQTLLPKYHVPGSCTHPPRDVTILPGTGTVSHAILVLGVIIIVSIPNHDIVTRYMYGDVLICRVNYVDGVNSLIFMQYVSIIVTTYILSF